MKTQNTIKNKHLTFEQRLDIQEGLKTGGTFKSIAKFLSKSPSTISREVKRHLTIVQSNLQRKDKHGNPINEVCPLLLKPPFCCNPCKKMSTVCAFDKYKYLAKEAQKRYERLLVTSREGIPLNKASFYEMDEIISNKVNNGQKIYHAVVTSGLPVTMPTVYRYINKGYMSINRTTLPRAVRFKPRRAKPQEYVPKGLKIGRAYTDFKAFVEQNKLEAWVEMDSVIGRIGGKIIVTFHFTDVGFMFGLLCDNKSSASVTVAIKQLKKHFLDSGVKFGGVFPVILTDNGGEFSDVFSIENDLDGKPETKLFFCDPYRSSQKPHVERNHSHLRDILPTGSSFDDLTQDDVNLIFSHINSGARPKFRGKTPYELFTFTYADNLSNLFGIVKVAPESVIQNSKLLTLLKK